MEASEAIEEIVGASEAIEEEIEEDTEAEEAGTSTPEIEATIRVKIKN